MLLIVIVFELTLLYFLSRRLTQNLYIATFLLTKSREISVGFLSLLFFPGTVIHELSHLFTAEILGVHTAGLTLVPEGIEKTNVRTGSVSIAETDPLRRAVIGVAPVFVGLGALFTISYLLPQFAYSYWILGIGYWLLFAVSNSMFSSPEDMEGFWPVAIVVSLVVGAMYIAGIQITFTEPVTAKLTEFAQSVIINVGYAVGLNIGLFLVSKILIAVVEKATGRGFIKKP